MSRERKLTREERILWHKVAASARPLDRRKVPQERLEAEPPSDPVVSVAPAAAGPVRVPAASAPRRAAVLNPIERPVTRKIARGHLELEARIDLHGLMQAEAHDLLRVFLVRAHARGLRHVLVITGKGASRGSEGVLRRAVPLWLATPELRTLVSGYSTAARGHGGEGALYIRLKRRRGDEA